MFDWIDDHLGLTLVAVFCVVTTLFIWVAYEDSLRWTAYSEQHHCIAVGTKEASTGFGTGIDSKGNMVTTTTYNPEQKIYRCDGGEIHIR